MSVPGEITILLHYWTTPTEYAADDELHRTSGFVQESLASFVAMGLLEKLREPNRHGGSYRATDALKVYIEAICAVNFPVQTWVIPQ